MQRFKNILLVFDGETEGKATLDRVVTLARRNQAQLTVVDVLSHRVHLVKGNLGTMIPQLAEKEQVDLIVMGTVCRTGLAGFFIGNTAERVLQQVDCSVLTVKPDGFVTPVTLEEE